MRQVLTTLIGYIMLAVAPALAQATPGATGRDIPWLWIIVVILVVGGGIWWYMNRMRGPRV
jgi:hypothetical protein